MTQGDLIQTIRVHERQLKILEEMIKDIWKKLDEQEQAIHSPIRRQIHAARQRLKQEGD